MPSVRYITNFAIYHGIDDVEAFSNTTLDMLNEYIYSNEDTSDWERGDMIRICLNQYEDMSWYKNQGLFFWNGYNAIFPFYDGNLNDVGSVAFEIDQQLDNYGYVPNTFDIVSEYDPDDFFNQCDAVTGNKIGFADLASYYDEIVDNCRSFSVENCHYESDGEITVTSFYANGRRFGLLFFGQLTSEICDYISANRPYDFDVEGVICEFNVGMTTDHVQSYLGLDWNDRCMFIHPRMLSVQYDTYSYGSSLDRRIADSRVSYTSSNGSSFANFTNQKKVKNKKKKQVSQCGAYTSKGYQCTRMSKSGEEYCGIHLLELSGKKQCSSYTGKGVQCNRMCKDGYDYCGIHL